MDELGMDGDEVEVGGRIWAKDDVQTYRKKAIITILSLLDRLDLGQPAPLKLPGSLVVCMTSVRVPSP